MMASGFFKLFSSAVSSLLAVRGRRSLLVRSIVTILVFGQCIRVARLDASQMMTLFAEESVMASTPPSKEQIAPAAIQASSAVNVQSDKNQTTTTATTIWTERLTSEVENSQRTDYSQASELRMTADIAPFNQTTRTVEKTTTTTTTTTAKEAIEATMEENPPTTFTQSPQTPVVAVNLLSLNQTTSTGGTTSRNSSKYRASTGPTLFTTTPINSTQGKVTSASINNTPSSVCNEKGGHKLLHYNKNPPFPHDLSSIFSGDGVAALNDPNVTRAICVVEDLGYNWVHTLQKLYPCISFWQAAPQHQKRVLANRRGKPQEDWSGFIKGLVTYLTLLFDVSVINGYNEELASNKTVSSTLGGGKPWDLKPPPDGNKTNINAYDVVTPLHLNTMRDRIVRHMYANNSSNVSKTHMDTLNTCNTAAATTTTIIASDYNLDDGKNNNTLPPVHRNDTTTSQRRRVPRIRILNRAGTRTILNVNEVAEAIRQRLLLLGRGGGDGLPLFSPPPPVVSIEYFEKTNFEYQVGSMAETDILISPHGAQLGSLPFLPDCSQVLEMFPEGYWIPAYYGSLAQAGGSGYQYLYLGESEDTMRNDTRSTIASRGGRIHARKQKLCAPVEAVVNAVDEMIQKWHSCCDRRI